MDGNVRQTEKPLRALSLRQPYAEAILLGKKSVEYRSRPTNIRERVYLYAAQKPGPENMWKKYKLELGSVPIGLLVGTVEVVGCKLIDGQYHWKLARPKRLVRKIKPMNAPQPIWFRPF